MSATTQPGPTRAADQAGIERAVEIICDRGTESGAAPQFLVGSGYLIGGATVLTAAHVAGDGDLWVRLVNGQEHRAEPEAVSVAGDLALLRVTDPAFPAGLPPVAFARVDRTSDDLVERCSAVGFPMFKERNVAGKAGLRDSAQLRGMIPPRSGLVSGHLEFQVTATPRALPHEQRGASEWEGISGSAVCAYHPRFGPVVVGVVVEHHRPEGPSSLTVVPITTVAELDDWRPLLAIEGADALLALPARPEIPPSPYWATVAELARRTRVLVGREDDLDYLTAFATGQVGPNGYLWLTGPKWAGKTALIAHFVRNLPGTVDVVGYFLTPNGDASSDRFVRVANDQLARLIGEGTTAETGDLDAFRMRWARAVELAEERQRHLLLVVDGLDEDTSVRRDLASVAAVLPRLTTGWAHVLVASGSEPSLPADVDPAHPLYSAQAWPLRPPVAEVVRWNRYIEARHQLCPLCKLKDEAESVLSVVGKQPPVPGTVAGTLRPPPAQSATWAIVLAVMGVLLALMGLAFGSSESTDELGRQTSNGGAGAFLVIVGLAMAGFPWIIVARQSRLRKLMMQIWVTLRYCHRDRVVFQSETGEWCLAGQMYGFLRVRATAARDAGAVAASPTDW